MRKALVAFGRSRQPLQWREIDIDRDLQLIKRFDSRVPVLCNADEEICHYFFDESALVAKLGLA